VAHHWIRDKVSSISVWRCINCDAMTCFGYKTEPDARAPLRNVPSGVKIDTGVMFSCDEIIAFTVQGA
jgi:hypothetical protein